MSPVKKIDEAQLQTWIDAYSANVCDEGKPFPECRLAQVRSRFEKFADAVIRLRDALRNPASMANAKIIANSDRAFPHYDEGLNDASAIDWVGDGIVWGLRGASPRVLAALRGAETKREREREARHAAWAKPEEAHSFGVRTVNQLVEKMIAVANTGEIGNAISIPAGPLTTEEKQAIVERLREAFGLAA